MSSRHIDGEKPFVLSLSKDERPTSKNVAVFEGLTQQQARERYPDLWSRNITRQWHAAPTDGESAVDVVSRVSVHLNALIDLYAQKVVVLVAHGFVAKTIRALARQDFSDFFDWQLGNGEVLELSCWIECPCTLVISNARCVRLEHSGEPADGARIALHS